MGIKSDTDKIVFTFI